MLWFALSLTDCFRYWYPQKLPNAGAFVVSQSLIRFFPGPLDLTFITLRGSMSQVKLCERDVRHIV